MLLPGHPVETRRAGPAPVHPRRLRRPVRLPAAGRTWHGTCAGMPAAVRRSGRPWIAGAVRPRWTPPWLRPGGLEYPLLPGTRVLRPLRLPGVRSHAGLPRGHDQIHLVKRLSEPGRLLVGGSTDQLARRCAGAYSMASLRRRRIRTVGNDHPEIARL